MTNSPESKPANRKTVTRASNVNEGKLAEQLNQTETLYRLLADKMEIGCSLKTG